jgi:murein DD-endopeptidase MepM/ murein hydrolase activator NlpD
MSKFTYLYNEKTCQYERSKVSVRDAIVYLLGLSIMSVVCFVGLTFLYNYLLETDAERALRAENRAIKKYKPVLEQKLSTINASLLELDNQDKALYAQLFNAPQPKQTSPVQTLPREKVLLAGASAFSAYLEMLELKTTYLIDHAAYSNIVFGNDIHISDEDVNLLRAVPSLPPVENLTAEHLASGYGDRVNPFHKGTYFHAGVDITFPRGTSVVAAANGVVLAVKRSELQAGYGNYVEIDHGKGFVSRYTHLEEIIVTPGQAVKRGMSIATIGNSGGSIAPHLHYEVLRDGEQVDPVLYMMETPSTDIYSLLLKKNKKQNQSLD